MISILCLLLLSAGEFKLEAAAKDLPEIISAEQKKVLNPAGIRISTKEGRARMDLWLRKEMVTKKVVDAPFGVRYPMLENGTLIGVLHLKKTLV